MLFKAGKWQVLSLVTGIIVLAGTFSLAGCITLSPGPSTQDNTGSTSTSAEPSQGMKVASLKGATLGNTGVFSKVAVNTTIDSQSSLVSLLSAGNGIKGLTATGIGVFGDASSSGTGLEGHSVSGYGVIGKSTSGAAINGSSTSGTGVNGWSETGTGVFGKSNMDGNSGSLGHMFAGVWGESKKHSGVHGSSPTGSGVYGQSQSGTAIYGDSTGTGNAGYFKGNVVVSGTLSKGGGTFKIDHPQDPANKYLSHSFVESPDMMNVYNGNITLDANGEAIVALPAYFESLNRDFRYQLTCIGGYAPVYVAEKVKDNSFKIAGGKAGIEVSWQVTGVRQDAFAKAHPVIVEQEKPANEKGFYLHPVELGQPAEKGIK